jgi:hypothetical protein
VIEIKRKDTGEVLHTVDAGTLEGAILSGAHLNFADLGDANLSGADLRFAILSGANLSNANLSNANLSNANLSNANLSRADLNDANLSRADLNDAILSGANLGGADLGNANLNDANLRFAILSGAHLGGANLSNANLSNANLGGANLGGANLNATMFVNCADLYKAKGLDQVRHYSPSALDASTLRANVCHLPDVFLQGVGYTNEEIENLRAMYQQGIRFYSCFLSYARLNSEFADRLRTDLIANSIRCWQDVHDLKGGDYWRKQINEAIKLHDKLIVVCSQDSLARPEVVEEIIEAIEHEQKEGIQKLFPVRLDDYLFTEEADRLAYETLPPRQRRQDWLTYLRDYQVPDFSGWKNHDAYQTEFKRLLRDLKATPDKR